MMHGKRWYLISIYQCPLLPVCNILLNLKFSFRLDIKEMQIRVTDMLKFLISNN